jgi:WD40 repeat protein/serine/threonine protein kinase
MRERDLFIELLQKTDPADRIAYLDAACAGDDILRGRVLELLAQHEKNESFLLDAPAPLPHVLPNATIDLPITEAAGSTIAGYKLVEQIGEGGMGAVWMAQQTEPVKRLVAVKLIKAGMDSKQVIARFEAERQALALMDHPNIARVLDGGTTDAGRPYFVMDLVKGVPITKYCDEHHFTPRQRLELFLPVCQAVQHAHQKGIIHRDLKPSNVLVAQYDGKPVPKVIDFGVAKAAGQSLTDKTLVTGFGAIVGTLEYMSPEQAEVNQLDIDTRSDIYSLGVLLYELLTGSPPFSKKDLENAGMLEMLRVIREQEPSKPSTKLSSSEALPTLSANRGTEPAKLTKLVRGELDWIVMKALEKDRNRRYETANGFAADVQRYLADEPVQACPPSAGYRLRKFGRRNKRALTTVALLTLALLVTIVVLAVSNVVVGRERDQKAQALHDKETALLNESAALVRATKQEILAKENAARAETQKQAALEQERIAKEQTLLAHRRFYDAQMNLADQASESGNPARVLDLLAGQRPRKDEEDLRTFEWYYLWRQLHRGRRLTLRGHRGWVGSVAFSPNSRTLASSSSDGTVRLWDVASGQSETIFDGDGSDLPAVEFSPDGKTLAWVSHDRMVRVWDVATRKLRWSLAGHTDLIWTLAFSPDGKTLVTGSQDKSVRVWDLAAGKAVSTLAGHQYPVQSVAVSPDGKTMASASGWEADVKVWDVAARKERFTVPGGYPVAFLPDGALACLGHFGTGATVWDVATGKKLAGFSGNGGRLAMAVAPDGKTLGYGGFDRNVMLWNVVTGQKRAHHPRLAPIHSLAFSPNGKLAASGTDDGIIELWDMTDASEPNVLPQGGNVGLVAFSADARSLVAFSENGLKRWDTATGMELGSALSKPQNTGRAALSPDSSVLAAEKGEYTICLWNMRTGQEIHTLRGHTDHISGLAISADGKSLASVGGSAKDGSAKVWDLNAGAAGKVVTINPQDGVASVGAVAFSPDGKTLATGGQGFALHLWDPQTGRQKAELQTHLGHHLWTSAVAFSPDGKTLAAAGTFGFLQLWDVPRGQLRAEMKGQTETIHTLTFSPDGLTLVSGGTDGIVRLWDVHTGQERLTLKGQRGTVLSAAFAADGLTLATGSTDGTVRLWRATADGEPGR